VDEPAVRVVEHGELREVAGERVRVGVRLGETEHATLGAAARADIGTILSDRVQSRDDPRHTITHVVIPQTMLAPTEMFWKVVPASRKSESIRSV
jgi:hypothetical protein